MRTTWNVDDEIVEELKEYARARTIPAGKAVTILLKQALHKPLGTRVENGFEVFDLPDGSPMVTLEHTLRLEDEL
jgi:hypothetical protein